MNRTSNWLNYILPSLGRGRRWVFLLLLFYILPSIQRGAGGGSLFAQEVTVTVHPVQHVLPPQAGQYVDNPGKFFTVRLTNNTDDEVRLHMGMHIDMTYPETQSMVVTPYGHIPRAPIVLAPRQSKILDPIQMKNLFTHFELEEIYIRDGLYNDYKRGIFGLLPEGQYSLYLQAYLWDPDITSAVQLNSPDDGMCNFTVCYTAQAPSFLTPATTIGADPLDLLGVAKLDINAPIFTWTQPTLNCNPTLLGFNYSVKVVRLDGLMPDEAIEKNPVVYSRERLTTPTLTIPQAYLIKMLDETRLDPTTVYAVQVTANSTYRGNNSLNFALIENEGKSPVLLFRLYDPRTMPVMDGGDTDIKSGGGDIGGDGDETGKGGDGKGGGKTEDGSEISVSVTNGEGLFGAKDSLYIFEQPTLIRPQFSSITARKMFVGEDIELEWRKAWFAGGRGEEQDTIDFEYKVQLYKGNSADEPEVIFKQKPVLELKTKELEEKIAYDKIEGKVRDGDYLIVRVEANSTNEKSIRMLPDSLNYKDFFMIQHFDPDYSCGVSTANVANKNPIKDCPKAGTKVRIGDWTMELNGDVKQDKKTKALSGTGWVSWTPGTMKVRMAVKFDKLMVNTDLVVFDGVCVTYPKDKDADREFTSQEAVDEMFSSWGLDNFWGDMAISEEGRLKVTDEDGSLAERLKLGKYYTYFKKAQNQWSKWKSGQILDLYFPTELPPTIADQLPEDFSLQIASVQISPKAAVMNVIGEFVLPKVDVIKNEVLIFGAPRLCMQKDRFFPEDGTLALLSNFTIKDPDSDFDMTFKAPANPLNPQDGCYVSWDDDTFGGLGIEVAMHIPNLDRVVNGKVQKDVAPVCDLKAVIENTWGDWMGKVTMSDFQVRDLPGFTFSPGSTIIYDHSYNKNDDDFPFKSVNDAKKQYGDTYDPSLCGTHVRNDWKCWQGLYIDKVQVQFPQWAVFGTGKKGATISADRLVYDDSGLSLDIAGRNLLNAQTGEAGGWKFSIDSCVVHIVQNNFNNSHITGQFAVPLFGKDNKQVDFVCDIRHLTDPAKSETYYTYEQKYDSKGKAIQGQYTKQKHTRKSYGDKSRYAYLFRTSQKLDLQMDFILADLTLDHKQTFFALAAEEQDDGTTKTDLELCMGGDVTIAKTDGMKIRFPGIHFTKLYVSNFKRSAATKANNMVLKYDKELGGLESRRQQAEKLWETKYHKLKILMEEKEIQFGSSCYVNFGEWSLASAQKKLGPFKFTLNQYVFSYDIGKKRLGLSIDGTIGLVNGMIDVGAIVDITSDLKVGKATDLSTYKLTNGKVTFRDISLNLDFARALKLKGLLKMDELSIDKGYKGELNFDIIGLFGVKCKGGYLEHIGATAAEIKKLKAEALGKGLSYDPDDANYPWGYFTCDISSGAGIQIPPLAINRIAGGFYFNARPVVGTGPVGEYGLIGASLGVGLMSSAGESVLKGDLDLSVVYNRKANSLSTFLFKGSVSAVSGIIKGDMTLLYENNKTDRFLNLDITVETGLSAENLVGLVDKAGVLEEIKADMDKFQSGMEARIRKFSNDTNGSLDGMLGDDSPGTATASENTGKLNAKAAAKQSNSENNRFGQLVIPFNLKVTWKERSKTYNTPHWHLYLGKPQKEERCRFILINYRSPGGVINVKIGADGYLCIGNELPGNGQLPPIPDEIQEFISPGGVDTGADMGKAERQRNAAARHLHPTEGNVNGGIMVGASAWGFIDINLGLFYGGLKAIAGFDMSLVHYDPAGYCMNLDRTMGKNGWYAQGQFYAYLAAKFGLYIKLGKLIDKKIDIVDAGIGGVFSAGLPSPTWIDGRARVKLRLLAGLVNINKAFHFECGQYCEAFMGNALDNFNLFGDLTIASDSLAEGWAKENAILPIEANRAMITTEASLGAQYRLVDPNTENQLSRNYGLDKTELKLNASRTYMFDFSDGHAEMGTLASQSYAGYKLYELTSEQAEKFRKNRKSTNLLKKCGEHGVYETNIEMYGKYLGANMKETPNNTYFYQFENFIKSLGAKQIPVTKREKRGTRYHFNMALKPDRYYIMIFTGTGYEIENGVTIWPTLIEKNAQGNYESKIYQWVQRKLFYFRTQSTETLPDVVPDLQPYVALAYPASDDGKLFNSTDDGSYCYYADVHEPTIALNTDISGSAFKQGTLWWESVSTDSKGNKLTDRAKNKYVRTTSGGTAVNMVPERALNVHNTSGSKYNLRLVYQYKVKGRCKSATDFIIDDKYYKIGSDATPGNRWAFMYKFLSDNGYYNDIKPQLNEYYRQANGNMNEYYNNAYFYAFIYLLVQPEKAAVYNNYVGEYGKMVDCMVDTTLVLSDLHFKRSSFTTWKCMSSISSSSKSKVRAYSDLLPYEQPFVGVRPSVPVQYKYDNAYDDQYETGSGKGAEFEKNQCFKVNSYTKDYRMKDPYLYLAYLSEDVFIGGVAVNAYGFDEVPVPHAAETLTFTYNGTEVQGLNAVNTVVGHDVLGVRAQMYHTWHDWNYGLAYYSNNSNQPKYPLPAGLTEIYDRTFINQDGKAGTYRRGYDIDHGNKYPWLFSVHEYMKDFAAPYYLAERLSEKMDDICQKFYGTTSAYMALKKEVDSKAWDVYPSDKIKYRSKRQEYIKKGYSEINAHLNTAIRKFSDLHRGQYLTAEYRGFKIRVPYYQFPLIFGDCFRTENANYQARDYISGREVDAVDRTFATSVGNALKPNRGDAVTSNLLFFRLCGGYPYLTSSRNNYDKVNGHNYIHEEHFYAGEALDEIKSMPTMAYRVNAYDLGTGQYFWTSGLKTDNTFSPYTFDPLVDPAGKEITKGLGSTMMNYIYGKGVDPSKYVTIDGGGIENDLNPKEGGVK